MIYYIRDEEGSLIGLKYNNKIYYYIKNLQEDIIGITDSNYNEVCRYEYDSFGRIITIKDNNGNIIEDESHIGIINPYRYRSYYYDKETRVYYLNSRYYNPEWGRFINADGVINGNRDILGYNLYVYVSNNPINYIDCNGKSIFDSMSGISFINPETTKKQMEQIANIGKLLVDSFVFEAEAGFGAGASAQIGEVKASAEITKTFGYSYSNKSSNQYTSTVVGASVGYRNKATGLSLDVRHYDEGFGNPMVMPWEIWNDANTARDLTVGLNYEYKGVEVNDKGGYFVGVSFGAFLVVGVKVKIGFNIGG